MFLEPRGTAPPTKEIIGLMKRITMALVATLSCLLLAACGSSTTTTTQKAAAPTTTSAPVVAVEPSTAYDQEILSESEKDIRKQLREIAKKNPGDLEDITSHCIGESDRNYTCTSTLILSFDDGTGTKMCTQISGTQKGNVDPDGSYIWKNADSESGEPYGC